MFGKVLFYFKLLFKISRVLIIAQRFILRLHLLSLRLRRSNENKQRQNVLGLMTLHNGMILSTLSISSHRFALSFLKKARSNGDNIVHL